jgi:large subunit ribosomal protein L4
MKADVINLKNEKVSAIEVPETVFGAKWNPVLVHQALLAQLANKRNPVAHAKFRGEVRGGGKKPWRQKGTGRARHGSTRSPIWVGGGKAHGPRAERDYSQKLNKKMRRLAIMSVLSKKFKDGEIKFLDTLAVQEAKTKGLASNLKTLLNDKKTRRYDVLMIPDAENKLVYRAARNLNKAKALSPASLNVYDLLNHKQIVIEEKAIEAITKHYALSK